MLERATDVPLCVGTLVSESFFIPGLGGLVFISVLICTGVHLSVALPPHSAPESLQLWPPQAISVRSACWWEE